MLNRFINWLASNFKGDGIILQLAEMNLLEEYWGKDATKFDPYRFVRKVDNCHYQNTSDFFFPFGDGPKGCVGQFLGRAEVESVLEVKRSLRQNYEKKSLIFDFD